MINIQSKKFHSLVSDIFEADGVPYFVGGCVRNYLQGMDYHDIDIECHEIEESTLLALIAKHADKPPFIGGKSFGVIKTVIDCQDFDFSLTRQEIKTGDGHRGFEVSINPFCGLKTATLRRDFTINAMLMRMDGTLIDFHNGAADLRASKLVAVSEKFQEDPLRVLRGMKFASRMILTLEDQKTINMMHKLNSEFNTLSTDRVWHEFEDLFLNGQSATAAMNYLVASTWVYNFPFLADMIGCEQDAKWHPEGDAFVHTGLVMDEMMELCNVQQIEGDRRIILLLAAMLHDIGKPATTKLTNGRITSAKHDSVGAKMVEDALILIGSPKRFIEPVRQLVKYHMVHADKVTKSFVRRMAVKLAPATIADLALVMRADKSGRFPAPKGPHPFAVKMLEIAETMALETKPPAKLVNGRDLIDLGVHAGPSMGLILKELYQAQLDGHFDTRETGLEFYSKNLAE